MFAENDMNAFVFFKQIMNLRDIIEYVVQPVENAWHSWSPNKEQSPNKWQLIKWINMLI